MKKEEKKKEFNPADYDYMDNMPLEGWIWEFIRRSKRFIDYYLTRKDLVRILGLCLAKSKSDNIINEYYRLLEKLDNSNPFFIGCHMLDPDTRWDSTVPISFAREYTKTTPVISSNLKYAYGYSMYDSKPLKELQPKIERDYKSIWDLESTDEYVDPTYRYKQYKTILADHPIRQIYDHQGKENIIMFLVDTSAHISTEAILELIKKQIIKNRKELKLPKGKKPKKLSSNELVKKSSIWKSYLVVYDLYRRYKSYSKVCDIISHTFPAGSKTGIFYGDEGVIKRHYKSAVKMINGGYLNYM